MDRSTHITYRKRQGRMEITISRGCDTSEFGLLFAKLARHRSSVPLTSVVLIKGGKKYRLGSLEEQDFEKLKEMIINCLSRYKQCGIMLVEVKPGSGAMYKPHMHNVRFKSDIRRQTGPFAIRVN